MSKTPNIGVIGIRDAWSTESLSEHLKAKNAGGCVIELHEICYDLDSMTFLHNNHNLDKFDGFILKKMGKQYSPHLLDELELLELMEQQGFRFFSSPRKIREMISRLSCTIKLRQNDIPMPHTFISESLADAADWVEENGPAILKPLYSTKARGMALLKTRREAEIEIQNLLQRGEKIIYLQKQMDLSGSDFGLVFLGGDYIGAYARVGDGSTWHTTTRQGGKYAAFQPDQELIDLAQRAQAPFELDFTCVDIAITKEMGPVVFEVSAFGGYKGLYQSSDINASDMLTDYAINKVSS